MTFAFWTHDLSPFLIRFNENFGIRYYGLAYLLGFLTGGALLQLYYRKGRSPLGPEKISDLMMAVVLGVFLGGRLGYFVFYRPEVFLTHPVELIRIWEGGMASHGGFIGVLIALAIFARRSRLSFFIVGDLLATITPPGLLLGRLANFINGELWGKPSGVPWAVIFPGSGDGIARHPSQLYEAGLEGLVLLCYVQLRFWRSDIWRRCPGQIGGEFLIGYAIVRMVCEVFREPDASLFLGLSRGTFYSLFLIAAGVVVIFVARQRGTPPARATVKHVPNS